MKSSPQARKLLRFYVKKYGSEREAAKVLGITHGQLNGILSGRLRDTDAVKAALDAAQRRAACAWSNVRPQRQTSIDPIDPFTQATLRAVRRDLEMALKMCEDILRRCR